MPKAALVGSALSHGGSVTKGSSITDWNGTPIARIGDEAVCSKHGKVTIIEGSAIYYDEGKKVALVGHKCSCGATIVSSSSLINVAS